MRKITMVVPCKETPRSTIWLSDVDLIGNTPFAHSPLVYIYPNPINNIDNSTTTFPNPFDSITLKSSLSEVLVPFYPVAGRLRKNDENSRFEIDCNAKGVLFVEVDTSYNTFDFGEFTPSEMLKKLVTPSCNYEDGLASMPLLMVQLTRFRCGGVALCFAVHHLLGDLASYVHLINQWARLASQARGAGLTVLPHFDRTKALVARNPPQVKFNHLECEPHQLDSDQFSRDSHLTKETTRVEIFKFSRHQLIALQRQATPTSHKERYSTYEVLAAHVWRCALKARGIKHDKYVKFFAVINGRRKFNQSILPQGYFGNFVFKSDCASTSGDILSMPLWYAASRVREAVTRVNEEYIRSYVDFLSIEPELTALANGPHTSGYPNILVNYWKGIPFYEADFGWGKPVYVRRAMIVHEGQSFIAPSENGDCLFVAINLFKSHMDCFEKIIYDFDERRAAL